MERQRIAKVVRETLLQYGFILLPIESASDLIDCLRNDNLLQFFRVDRSERYVLIELNTLPCKYECDSHCHNHNGYKDENCYISCLYGCKEERLNVVISKIRSLY
jgi:hypothetical protein